jgi:hypothetical protein
MDDDIHHFGYKQQSFFSQICEVGGLAIIQKMDLAKFG